MNESIKAIFIDLYGTLTVGDVEAINNICSDIVNENTLSITSKELADAWGKHIWEVIKKNQGCKFRKLVELEEESLKQALSDFSISIGPTPYIMSLEKHWQNPTLRDDAYHFINNIDLPICIVSNADRVNAENAIKGLSIQPEFLITSEDAGYYKPSPEIFNFALKKTGWFKKEVIHVGDSLHGDIEAAKKAGLLAVLLSREHSCYDPGDCKPDYEIRSLSELMRVMN